MKYRFRSFNNCLLEESKINELDTFADVWTAIYQRFPTSREFILTASEFSVAISQPS